MIFYDKNKKNTNIVSGLNIGSDTISCFIVDTSDEKNILLGFGYNKNLGMDKNNVIDIKRFRDSIQKAIQKAESSAGLKIEEIYVSSSSLKPKTNIVNTITEVPYGKAVSNNDLKNAFKKLDLSKYEKENDQILHIFPLEYKIDGRNLNSSPIGLFGSQLQIKYNVITTNKFAIQNIKNLIKGCMVDIKAITTSGYSSGLACMKMLGNPSGNYVVLDIGASNTSISLFSKNSLVHLGTIALGGEYITDDIAKVLNTDKGEAERIKNLYGSLEVLENDFVNRIDISAWSEDNKKEIKTISKGDICNVIKPRVEEIANYINIYLNSRNALNVLNRVIITGGTTNIDGIEDAIMEVLKKPVVKVKYNNFTEYDEDILDPALSALWGLIEYKKLNEYDLEKNIKKKNNIFERIRGFFEGNF